MPQVDLEGNIQTEKRRWNLLWRHITDIYGHIIQSAGFNSTSL